MRTNKTLLFIVQTALLLALTLVFQIYVRALVLPLGDIGNTLIVGSLVNLCLFVAAGTVGWRGSTVIAVVAPVVALLMGHIKFLPMMPFVAIGNLVLCLLFELISRKKTSGAQPWIAVGVSAVSKFVVLYLLMVVVFVGLILPGLVPADKAAGPAKLIGQMFSWPQLVTALIGGIVAVPVIAAVRKALQHPQSNESKA